MAERILEKIKSWEDVLPGDLLTWAGSDLVVEFSGLAQHGFSGTVRGDNDLDYEDGMTSDTWSIEIYREDAVFDRIGWRKIITSPPERKYDPSQEPDDEDDV